MCTFSHPLGIQFLQTSFNTTLVCLFAQKGYRFFIHCLLSSSQHWTINLVLLSHLSKCYSNTWAWYPHNRHVNITLKVNWISLRTSLPTRNETSDSFCLNPTFSGGKFQFISHYLLLLGVSIISTAV